MERSPDLRLAEKLLNGKRSVYSDSHLGASL